MSTWYERGVFYHMYPLGMTGAPKHNENTEITHRFDQLNRYIPHLNQLGFNAIYIGPLFESSSTGTTPGITSWWTGVWATTATLKNLWPSATRAGSRLWWTACSTTQAGNSSPSATSAEKRWDSPTKTGTRESTSTGRAPGRSLRLRGLAGTLRTALPESV